MFRVNSFIYYNQFFNKSYFLQYLRKKVIDLTKYSNIMDPVFYLFQNDESYVNNFQDLTRDYLEELDELSQQYNIYRNARIRRAAGVATKKKKLKKIKRVIIKN